MAEGKGKNEKVLPDEGFPEFGKYAKLEGFPEPILSTEGRCLLMNIPVGAIIQAGTAIATTAAQVGVQAANQPKPAPPPPPPPPPPSEGDAVMAAIMNPPK